MNTQLENTIRQVLLSVHFSVPAGVEGSVGTRYAVPLYMKTSLGPPRIPRAIRFRTTCA